MQKQNKFQDNIYQKNLSLKKESSLQPNFSFLHFDRVSCIIIYTVFIYGVYYSRNFNNKQKMSVQLPEIQPQKDMNSATTGN